MADDSDSETSFPEHLISSRNRDLSFFLPFIWGFQGLLQEEKPMTHRHKPRSMVVGVLLLGFVRYQKKKAYHRHQKPRLMRCHEEGSKKRSCDGGGKEEDRERRGERDLREFYY
ncbi:hypothetical protein BVC80_1509g3 [Macleaya cordata]|uniref:Uncharacterized protein n=1 Tax=Macleaya cordata TaxID=56857 RepID=A0A200PYT7_MACCD|nr:hypothetical protein BVC80_1509g3 [Macleaya cordata]